MAKAGLCAQCGANVWLREDGGCVNGHDASQISGVYEADMPAQDAAAGGSDASAQVNQVANDVGQGLTEAGQQLGDLAKQAWSWGKKQASSNDQTGGGS
jgi:hypothetical protein